MTRANCIALGVAFACCIQAIPAATAAQVSRTQVDSGGPACLSSAPSSSSKLRQRATGMRNEGAGSEFVICQYTTTSAPFIAAWVFVSTIDGADHSVQCTGVNGGNAGGAHYSSKSVNTGSIPGTSGNIKWTPEDFGGTDSFPTMLFSVTCLLPGGASIDIVQATYVEYTP
jgi:hypothetical protein